MSAEKDIVNFWFQQQGYFTIENLNVKGHKESGILALGSKGKGSEVLHIEVRCSVTGQGYEAKQFGELMNEAFFHPEITSAIGEHISSDDIPALKRVLVLGTLSDSKKEELGNLAGEKTIALHTFETIFREAFEKITTKYYKNDVLRTIQLFKYVLLGDPRTTVSMLGSAQTGALFRQQLIQSLLDQEHVRKSFRQIDPTIMGDLIKESQLKNPQLLAQTLHAQVLNAKTRKPFVDSLFEQKSMKRYGKKAKKQASLARFL